MSEDVADTDLILAHVNGDPDAFSTLVVRHQDRLWAVALRTLSDREEAADALQDAMISAFRNAGSFRGESAVTTWLHRIVVNACLDRVRRRQARPTTPLPEREIPLQGDDHARTEARLDVRAALARLPEAQRLALVLVDLEDLSVAEAAQLLEVPEGTIKSRCSRGRLALAQLLRLVEGPVEGPVESLASGPTASSPSSAPADPGNRDDVPRVASRQEPTGRGGAR